MKTIFNMKTNLALATLTASFAISGCSLNVSDGRVVRIPIPKTSSKSVVRNASYKDPLKNILSEPGALAYAPPAASISSFACYGLNVTGPGIPDDPRMQCGGPNQHVGIFAGFVPAGVGYLEVYVPSGAARHIQLFGSTSSDGSCPDLNVLIDAMNQGDHSLTNNISEPYLLGEATVDLFDDVDVTIHAAFDPAHPQRPFSQCGGANQPVPIRPTFAYGGAYTYAAPPSQITTPILNAPAPAPSPTPGNVSLPLGQVIDVSTLPYGLPETDLASPSFDYFRFGSPGTGYRAAVQFHWDVTDLDLVGKPYVGFNIQLRGGAEGSACPNGVGEDAVAAGVWNASAGYWMPIGKSHRDMSTPRWSWAGGGINPSINDIAMTGPDGRKYVVVNVESNYFSLDGSCESAIRLARADLLLSSQPVYEPGHPLYLNALGGELAWGNGYNSDYYLMPTGSTMSFYTSGGVPPYTYSVSQPSLATIDASTGRLSSGPTVGTFTVRVTDSGGNFTERTVNILSAGSPVKMTISNAATATAGDCLPVTVNVRTFGGALATSVPAMTVNLEAFPEYDDLVYTPAIEGYFTTNLCSGAPTPSGPSNSFSLTAGQNSIQTYVKVKKAGNTHFRVYDPAASNPVPGSYGMVNVGVGAAQWIRITGPSAANEGACVPMYLFISDAGGNFIPGQSTSSNLGLNAGGFGMFYSEATCASGSILSSVIGVSNGTQPAAGVVYFKPGANTAMWASLSVADGGGTPLFNYGHQIMIRAAGEPVKTELIAGATINGCRAVTVALKTSQGAPGIVPANYSFNGNLYSKGSLRFYAADCATSISNVSIVSGYSEAVVYVKPDYVTSQASEIYVEGQISNIGNTDNYHLPRTTIAISVP